MKKKYKGKVNHQGVELAPDWTEMGFHPITGYHCHTRGNYNIAEERARQSNYQKDYYLMKKQRNR